MTTSGVTTNLWTWPFPTQDPKQYQRVDQGWDLQGDPGTSCLAIADGTVGISTPNPGGFGNDYPYLIVDPGKVPLTAPTDTVYYGHVHVDPLLIGKHVVQGTVIAHANVKDGDNGSAAPPGWLEIGFSTHGTGAPAQSGTGALPNGNTMKLILSATGVALGTINAGGAASTGTSGKSTTPTETDLIKAAQAYASTGQPNLPDPRTNLPFSPAFLGQAVPGGSFAGSFSSLGGLRWGSPDDPSLIKPGTVFQAPSTSLVRGGMSELPDRPGGRFQVFFMMNPEEVDFDYEVDSSQPIPGTLDPLVQSTAQWATQNMGVSFSVVFNRMYEVWQGGFDGPLGGPSSMGVRWDVRALERLLGIFDEKAGTPGHGVHESGPYGPMGLPVQIAFGGPNSFRFTGLMNSLAVRYTRFDRNMIPVEATCNISALKIWQPSAGVDISSPITQYYLDTAVNPTTAGVASTGQVLARPQ